jgi:short chain dehydrogenase
MTATLITGANKGLGFETARRLIAAGHTVYIGSRDGERGRRAAEQLGARAVQLDVTDDASVQAAVKESTPPHQPDRLSQRSWQPSPNSNSSSATNAGPHHAMLAVAGNYRPPSRRNLALSARSSFAASL